jgi:hypothetical protein
MADELDSVQFIPKAIFNPASLNGTFQVMNGSGFADDVKIFEMFNGSLTVSQNSVTLNYTFVYVSSFDFPFTTSAFYGTAAKTQ